MYSAIELTTVEKFRMARYAVVSPDPENDAMDHIKRWMADSGLSDQTDFVPRLLGWDFPFVSKEQKELFGMHGYAAACTLPEDFEPACCGAEIVWQPTDRYAKITVTDPFADPAGSIPGAYGKIYEFANARGIVPASYEGRICMEEVYEKDGVTYMDVYVPVDEAR